jgi:murein DD-endopeptidase MepM/ murein hydrolase activator NlpD
MAERQRERNSMVEYELPKLDTWVRFPSLAPVLLLVLVLAGCKTATTPHEYNAVISHVGGVYHYVKGGDTLWSISKLYDVEINALISANNLDDSRDIQRGQKLLIPGTVKKEAAPRAYFSKEFFSWPLKGSVISYYGSKMDKTKNKGIDIHAAEGSIVKASRAGKVVFCDEWLKGFGKTIILDHGDSFQTVYAYNSILLVKPGDAVEQNGVIARVGRGGRAKEPSLHFEIRRNGEPQNPFYYLSR